MKKCSVFLFLLVTLAAVGQKEYRIQRKCSPSAFELVSYVIHHPGKRLPAPLGIWGRLSGAIP